MPRLKKGEYLIQGKPLPSCPQAPSTASRSPSLPEGGRKIACDPAILRKGGFPTPRKMQNCYHTEKNAEKYINQRNDFYHHAEIDRHVMMPDHTLMMLFVLQSGASRMSPSTDVSSPKSAKMDAFTLSQVAKKQKRGSCKRNKLHLQLLP